MPSSNGRRRRRAWPAVAATATLVAALATAAAAGLLGDQAQALLGTGPRTHSTDPNDLSATKPFPANAVGQLDQQLTAQKAVADRLFRLWQADHAGPDDVAFVAFAVAHTPPPPGPAAQAAEMDELRRLAASRTPDLIRAADRLEQDGKQTIWQAAGKAAAQQRPGLKDGTVKIELTETESLADQISHAAKARFSRDSPYINDPSLRPDKKIHAGDHNPCYPSTHAIYAYSQAAVLTQLDPADASHFQAIAAQVAYSRLYMAGHYRSDLITGAMLGYLIADYEASRHPH